MKLKVLLLFSSFTLLLNHFVNCEDERKGRVLNKRYDDTLIEKQLLQEYEAATQNNTDATADDVIEEIISSSRQGRNIEGLDDIYGDSNIKEALNNGNEIEARNLIRDKLCALGLMQCDEVIHGKRPGYPTRVIYSQPPPGAIYSNRPPPNGPPQFGPPPNSPQFGHPPQNQQHYPRPPVSQPPKGGIYGPAKPMPFPPSQPPRKIGYAHSDLNTFESRPVFADNKYSNTDFYEVEQSPPAIKFGYTEKPTIVVNQGKREAQTSQNHHVHHHYVHVDGSTNGAGLIDGTKTVLVNTPISEYSAVNSLSSSYQTSGFGVSGGSSSANGGFTPMNSDYKGVNSIGGSQGIYSQGSSVKPVYESNQYATGVNYNKYQQSNGPAVYTEGTNGIYSNGVQQSYHASAPDFYKKELNLNSANRGNGLSSGGGYSAVQNQQQQQQQQNYFNSQKQQLYSKNPYDQYQGIESSQQNQFDCVCVPFDQCPAHDVVGRRDDLILPLDPRNLPTEIEADGDNSTTTKATTTTNSTIAGEVKKISKREVTGSDNLGKVQGEGRLLGFGGGGGAGGYYGQNQGGYYPGGGGGKKILPTVGVSFGLPFPTYNYPLSPYAPHAPNAHFGAISPNGLNLGLVNVNPLFSLQLSKNEHGQKLVKPFVNLHVTPNEGIIGKIGSLFQAKKGALHKHYHHHLHRYPPPPPNYFEGHDHHYPHHPHGIDEVSPFLSHQPHHHGGEIIPDFHGPPHGGQIIPDFHGHGPPHGGQIIPDFHGPHFKDSGFSKDSFIDDISTNPGLLGFRSNNVSAFAQAESDGGYNYQSVYPQNNFNNINSNVKDEFRYARGFSNFNQNELKSNNAYSFTTQAPGTAEGSDKVSFPTSRRRRDTDIPVPTFDVKESKSDKAISAEEEDPEGRANKRQAFYQPQSQQKQCGPRAVCCRRPFKAPQQLQYSKCGVRNTQGITGRIKNPSYVDGDSEFGEWPWQAAILKKDPKESVYVCGGTLINNQYIITAAHCVKTYSGYDLRVRLGEWDVNHDVEFYPYVERDIISVHVHPEYYAGTLDNDIAILKLSAPVDLATNPHVTPACLPDKFTDFTKQRCWTTGWGKDNWEYGKYQNILKEVDVPIIEQNTCQNQLRQTRLGYSYLLNPGFICAGGEEGKDSCKGDGGGPLVCERNGVWQLVGAVSWGIGCGQQNVPGVYVRISHYLSWIEQITRY